MVPHHIKKRKIISSAYFVPPLFFCLVMFLVVLFRHLLLPAFQCQERHPGSWKWTPSTRRLSGSPGSRPCRSSSTAKSEVTRSSTPGWRTASREASPASWTLLCQRLRYWMTSLCVWLPSVLPFPPPFPLSLSHVHFPLSPFYTAPFSSPFPKFTLHFPYTK